LKVDDLEALQSDVTSLPAQEFQKLIASTPLKGDPQLNEFLSWDGKLTRESAEAALYEVWFQAITNAVSNLFWSSRDSRLTLNSGRPLDLEPDTILGIITNPTLDLFGDQPNRRRDQVLIDTLKSARTTLAENFGDQPAWGLLHAIHFRHSLDNIPGAKALFEVGPIRARPGDEYTVNATGTSGDSWDQVSGASYREILDAADWDRSFAVNTPGQSGQPGSPHYSDLLPLWDAGQYFPLVYSRKAVEKETTDRLRLEP
jgi:penicillin amidase